MVMKLVGLLAVVTGAIFLIMWGSAPSGTESSPLDFVLGVILIIGGVAALTYDPFEEAKSKVTQTAQRLLGKIEEAAPDRRKIQAVMGKVDDAMDDAEKEVRTRVRETTDDVSRAARKRINLLAREVEELTND